MSLAASPRIRNVTSSSAVGSGRRSGTTSWSPSLPERCLRWLSNVQVNDRIRVFEPHRRRTVWERSDDYAVGRRTQLVEGRRGVLGGVVTIAGIFFALMQAQAGTSGSKDADGPIFREFSGRSG